MLAVVGCGEPGRSVKLLAGRAIEPTSSEMSSTSRTTRASAGAARTSDTSSLQLLHKITWECSAPLSIAIRQR